MPWGQYGIRDRHSCEGETGKHDWSGYGKKLSNIYELTCYSAGGNGTTSGGCGIAIGARGTGGDTERK